jgi:hypothetical protein
MQQVGGKAGIWAGGMGIAIDGTRIFFATVSLAVIMSNTPCLANFHA